MALVRSPRSLNSALSRSKPDLGRLAMNAKDTFKDQPYAHTKRPLSPLPTSLPSSRSVLSSICVVLQNYSTVLVLTSFYVIVGITITFYNKFVLSSRKFEFEVSMILVHSFMNFALSALTLATCLRSSLSSSLEWPTRISGWHVITRFLPIGALLGFDITLTSMALRFSGVALTEIVKAGIPALVLIESAISKQEVVTKQKMSIVALICLGILLTTLGDVSLHINGLLAAVAATLCGASKLVLMQKIMSGKDKTHPVLSMFYLAPSSVISLLFPFYLFEARNLFASSFLSTDRLFSTCGMLALGGLLAFCLNISELLVIKYSSALSLCVAGVVKLIFLIALSAIFTGYQVTPVNALGILLSLLGVILYNVMKAQDSSRRMYLKISEESMFDNQLPDFVSSETSMSSNR